MKEHVLGASDRAALQSLIPLAGALGAGTIFGLFFGGRKRAGFAVFEIFAMVSVLVAVGSTAYFCIALLHANEAITDSDLTRTATPLILAAFLLVFVSILSRLPGSFERLLMLVPLAVGAAFVAALIAGASAWNTDPAHASLAAFLVLAVGAVLSLLTAWVDRMDLSWDRRSRRLRTLADAGWDDHAQSKAPAPSGLRLLLRVKVGIWLPVVRSRRRAQLVTLESSERRDHHLSTNEDGLFDVTALGLFA